MNAVPAIGAAVDEGLVSARQQFFHEGEIARVVVISGDCLGYQRCALALLHLSEQSLEKRLLDTAFETPIVFHARRGWERMVCSAQARSESQYRISKARSDVIVWCQCPCSGMEFALCVVCCPETKLQTEENIDVEIPSH